MRWFRIRKASIPKEERDIFEPFGATVIGTVLSGGFNPLAPELQSIYASTDIRRHAAAWLTEQYDRAERKETWSLTMEAAITVFVAVELVFSVLNFVLHRT
jgi:hypothetical protein